MSATLQTAVTFRAYVPEYQLISQDRTANPDRRYANHHAQSLIGDKNIVIGLGLGPDKADINIRPRPNYWKTLSRRNNYRSNPMKRLVFQTNR